MPTHSSSRIVRSRIERATRTVVTRRRRRRTFEKPWSRLQTSRQYITETEAPGKIKRTHDIVRTVVRTNYAPTNTVRNGELDFNRIVVKTSRENGSPQFEKEIGGKTRKAQKKKKQPKSRQSKEGKTVDGCLLKIRKVRVCVLILHPSTD